MDPFTETDQAERSVQSPLLPPSSPMEALEVCTSCRCRGRNEHPSSREYVRVASSGRKHFPLGVGAPLADFAAIAAHYPVYRIDVPGS
jgi:hypothetical protein